MELINQFWRLAVCGCVSTTNLYLISLTQFRWLEYIAQICEPRFSFWSLPSCVLITVWPFPVCVCFFFHNGNQNKVVCATFLCIKITRFCLDDVWMVAFSIIFVTCFVLCFVLWEKGWLNQLGRHGIKIEKKPKFQTWSGLTVYEK